MGMMIVRHKVRDYGQWRPIFDGHVSADSNKSEIVVVFDTKDTRMAKAFLRPISRRQ